MKLFFYSDERMCGGEGRRFYCRDFNYELLVFMELLLHLDVRQSINSLSLASFIDFSFNLIRNFIFSLQAISAVWGKWASRKWSLSSVEWQRENWCWKALLSSQASDKGSRSSVKTKEIFSLLHLDLGD